MIRQTLIVLTILTTLFGCDFSKRVEERVDNGIKDAIVEMNSDISKAKSDFKISYREVLQESKDSVFRTRVTNLYSSISKTTNYIDCLRIEINQLDDMDTKNVGLIKQIFLDNGIGATLFNKVKDSYSQTVDIAKADTTKARLKRVLATYSEDTKKQIFALNSPLGVNMILYGIESELIKDGYRSLLGHKQKNNFR